MVPVVGAEDGRWLVPAPLAPCMKPGGHGAIWKLMLDQGIFRWLASRGREAALIRQIRSALRQAHHAVVSCKDGPAAASVLWVAATLAAAGTSRLCCTQCRALT